MRERRSSSGRRGVSLLEVMFTIGVVVIGMMGVMALFPVAFYQAKQGTITDHAARVGRNAFQTFDVYGMNDPSLWRYADGRTLQPWIDVNTQMIEELQPIDWSRGEYVNRHFPHFSLQPPDRQTQNQFINSSYYVPQSFCLDPRIVTMSDTRYNPLSPGVRFAFPAPVNPLPQNHYPPQVQMPRLTFAHGLTGAVSPLPMWDHLFVSRDDLVVERPEDDQLPAVQSYGETRQNGGRSTLRQFEGDLSWMATLVPEIDGFNPQLPQQQRNADGYSNDLYLLSIVVFHKRDVTELGEQVGFIPGSGFPGGGVGGGEVTIATYNDGDPNTPPVDIKPTQWVLLAGRRATDGMNIFRWYQVAARDRKVIEAGQTVPGDPSVQVLRNYDQRYVTLEGSDWNYGALADLRYPTPGVTTEVIIMPGVVAVYEKTVRLESSTLWAGRPPQPVP